MTHDDAVARLRARRRQPVIFALWHGQLLPLLWHHRGEGVAVLISEHRDGEIIARIAEALGYRTVRGSTSRGAARALLGLSRVHRARDAISRSRPTVRAGPREVVRAGRRRSSRSAPARR